MSALTLAARCQDLLMAYGAALNRRLVHRQGGVNPPLRTWHTQVLALSGLLLLAPSLALPAAAQEATASAGNLTEAVWVEAGAPIAAMPPAAAIPNSGVAPAPTAMIDTLSVDTLNVERADPIRTTARLTVPAGAQWQIVMSNESLILSLESGKLRVAMHGGRARIARAIDSIHWIGGRNLDELAPGQATFMWAGDRLVVHGGGVLRVQSASAFTTTATVIRVAAPPTP